MLAPQKCYTFQNIHYIPKDLNVSAVHNPFGITHSCGNNNEKVNQDTSNLNFQFGKHSLFLQ